MRVLALLGNRPLPAVDAPGVRNSNLWSRLNRRPGVELKVLGLDLVRDPAAGPAVFPGVDAEFRPFEPRSLAARAAGVLTRSWHEYPRSPSLARRVDELAASWGPDVIHAEELRMAAYLPAVRGVPASAVQTVTLYNVESDLFPTLASPAVPVGRWLTRRLQVASLRRFEARVVAAVDMPLAFSALDRARYAELYPGARWGETRNGTDVEGVDPAPLPGTPAVLILATWSYPPNREGLRWFLSEVCPRLDPGVRLTVAGSRADPELKAWVAAAGGRFVDTPSDLRPLYAGASVVAVPLMQGGGTRTKVLEALAHERPVVTTTKGPEGLDLGPDEGVVIADDPAEFARRVGESLAPTAGAFSPAARRGREAMRDRYDWSVVARELVGTWQACPSRSVRAGRRGRIKKPGDP